MYNSGFESWNLGYSSDDTLYVYFIHEPIKDGAHIGVIPIPDRNIHIKSTYIYSNRLISSQRIKRKQFLKENY